MTLAKGEEQERRESCSFFRFYYPFSSPTFILSTLPFYCYPIVFSLIASCSLSHTSNTFQYPRSPAEHLEGRGRTRASTSRGLKKNMGINLQLSQCHHCHAWVQPHCCRAGSVQ